MSRVPVEEVESVHLLKSPIYNYEVRRTSFFYFVVENFEINTRAGEYKYYIMH